MSWVKEDIVKESNRFVQDLNKFYLILWTVVHSFLD